MRGYVARALVICNRTEGTAVVGGLGITPEEANTRREEAIGREIEQDKAHTEYNRRLNIAFPEFHIPTPDNTFTVRRLPQERVRFSRKQYTDYIKKLFRR